ncbi:hypothetical protein CMO92_05115 [Candidatus Woesearchaeota archaeon]|nr:hypothetical protein [Candidatus Woesearchaeota archaeon]
MSEQIDTSNMSPEEIAELQKKNCIFCKIISGEIPAKKVYEDDMMISILDINPAAKGHLLVLPKEHIPIMPLLPQPSFVHIFGVVKQLVKAQKAAMLSSSITTFIANGAAAGQQSPHFIFHLIPREPTDTLDLFNPSPGNLSKKDLTETTIKVKSRLQQLLNVGPSQDNRQKLAQLIESDPEIRRLLTEDIDALRERMKQEPELNEIFQGINLEQLADRIRQAFPQQEQQPSSPEIKQAEFEEVEPEEDTDKKDSSSDDEENTEDNDTKDNESSDTEDKDEDDTSDDEDDDTDDKDNEQDSEEESDDQSEDTNEQKQGASLDDISNLFQ